MAHEAGAVVVAHRSSDRRAVRGRIADRPARGTRGAASAITCEAPEAWVRTCSSPMMTGHR